MASREEIFPADLEAQRSDEPPCQAALLFSRVSWRPPEGVDRRLEVAAHIPALSPIPIREVSQVFTFSDDRLSRIDVVFQR